MQWVSALTITGGVVPKLYLKPNLFILKVDRTKTEEIVIENTTINTSLTRLEITNNYLNAIPNNINKLNSLSKLNFGYNRIQYLNLSNFIGLDNLTEINLSFNQLYAVISDHNIKLEKLTTLDLSNNLLTKLDFTNWRFPALQKLSVHENSLQFIKHFDEKTFPLLLQFSHRNNMWDCRWIQMFHLARRNVGEQGSYDYTTTSVYYNDQDFYNHHHRTTQNMIAG